MTTFTIPWTHELELASIDDLDADHRRLLDKIDDLLNALSHRDETRVLMACGALRAAAHEHFATEEALMRDAQYPDLEQHCLSHRRLLDSLTALRFTLDSAERFATTMGPYVFLERWFVAHLANDDRRFDAFMALRQRGGAGAASGTRPTG